jgi:hypothetical protein
MALTATKAVRLEDAGFGGLFSGKRSLWKGLAKEAYEYVATQIEARGESVRADDLIPPLLPVLEISPDLRDFLDEKKLTQKYWYQWFGEWIVDQVWAELP